MVPTSWRVREGGGAMALMPWCYTGRNGLVRLVGRLPVGMGALSDTAALSDRLLSTIPYRTSAVHYFACTSKYDLHLVLGIALHRLRLRLRRQRLLILLAPVLASLMWRPPLRMRASERSGRDSEKIIKGTSSFSANPRPRQQASARAWRELEHMRAQIWLAWALHASALRAVCSWHGMPTHIISKPLFEDFQKNLTAASCQVLRLIAIVLRRAPDRVALYRSNRQRLLEAGCTGTSALVRIDAIDGLERDRALDAWRALGIRFVRQHPRQTRSFGAFTCTLSHLRILLSQVRHGWPYLLHMEDDVNITDATRFRDVVLYCLHFMRTASTRTYSMVRLGYNSELTLTTLSGAQRILGHYCHAGIDANIDDSLERFEKRGTAHGAAFSAYIPTGTERAWRPMYWPGDPRGGRIAVTGHHLNSTRLRLESELWPEDAAPRRWCSDGTLRDGRY